MAVRTGATNSTVLPGGRELLRTGTVGGAWVRRECGAVSWERRKYGKRAASRGRADGGGGGSFCDGNIGTVRLGSWSGRNCDTARRMRP